MQVLKYLINLNNAFKFTFLLYNILQSYIVKKGTISLEKSCPGYDISGEIVPRVRFLLGTISPGYDFS